MPKPTILNDSVELCDSSQREYTKEGFMIAPAIVARTGIQFYTGNELGDKEYQQENNLEPDKVYSIYRPSEEVFNPNYLTSITGVTLVNNDEIHQSGKDDSVVTADNWKKNSVGEVLNAEQFQDRYVRSKVIVRDSKAIKDINNGKNQVSLGYSSELEWTPGVDQFGTEYHAIQKNMNANHLAIVKYARAGGVARIADSDNKNNNNNKEVNNMIKILADGTTIEVAEGSVAAVETILKKLEAQVKLADEANSRIIEKDKIIADMTASCDEKDKDIADKAKAIDEKEEENKKLKADSVSAADLDAKVADRAETVEKGKKLADGVDYKGLSNHEYRKAIITQVIADASMKTMCDAISGEKEVSAFDEFTSLSVFNALSALKSTAVKNTQSTQSTKTVIGDAIINAGNKGVETPKEPDAQTKHKESIQNAWKNK